MAAPVPAAAFPRSVVMMDSYKDWRQDRKVRSIADAARELEDAARLHDGMRTHVEVLEAAADGSLPLAKFYFDFDDDKTHATEPSDAIKAETYDFWATGVRAVMSALLGDVEVEVAVATRSRAKGDTYKLSAHIVVQGHYATVPEIKAVAAALMEWAPGIVDLQPYSRRQSFACVNCCKERDNMTAAEVMRPLDPDVPIHHHLLQAFDETALRLVVPRQFMDAYGVRDVATFTSANGVQRAVTDADQKLALALLPLIQREASGERGVFVSVGHHLHQIFAGSDVGLKAFDDWAAPHPSYKGAAYVADKWRTFEPRADAPLAALRAKAKAHSPDRYDALMAARQTAVTDAAQVSARTQRFVDLFGTTGDGVLDSLIANAIATPNHTAVALVALRMFGDRIVCASKKHNLWYEFRDHRWHRDMAGSVIANALSFDMYHRLNRRVATARAPRRTVLARLAELNATKRKTAEQAAELAELQRDHGASYADIKQLADIADDLRMVGAKSAFVSEYANKSVVANRGFASRLDERRHLLGFSDGVYDLAKGEFRAGRPDDYLSMSTGYEFPREDDADKQATIRAFYESCAPNTEVANYDLTITAYNLGGDNYLEQLWFYTGVGRNGKGVKVKLIKAAFGDASAGEDMPRGYCYEPDASILTSKRTNASAPCPEVVLARGVRLMVISEPQNGDKASFNVSLLKGLSGNDAWTGRELHMPPITFQPQFGILGCMNNVPHLDGADNAFGKRLRVVAHTQTFVDDPKLPNERKIDMTLKSKFENDITYAQQFMRMLLRIYREERLWDASIRRPEPDEVLAATREVMEEDDQVREWLAEFGERDADAKTKVPDAREHFKEWLRRHDDRAEPMGNVEFNRRMRANGWKQGRVSHSVRSYEGLCLRPMPPADDHTDF